MFNFWKDYLTNRKHIGFKTRPELSLEYKEEGIKYYSMDKHLVFYNGKENLTILTKNESGATFHTDIASIPTWLHWLYPPDNKKTKLPSILHDGLYEEKTSFARLYADWMYLLAMRTEGVNFFVRWFFFLSVRIFGKKYRGYNG